MFSATFGRGPRKTGLDDKQREGRRKAAFLETFARVHRATLACQAADVRRRTVYCWLARDQKFASAYRQAELASLAPGLSVLNSDTKVQ